MVVALFSFSVASDFYKFSEFIQKYGKDYQTKEEFDYRFSAFQVNLKKIDELNAANIAAGGSAVFGVNIFADMPYDEFAQRLMTNLSLPPVEPFISIAPAANIDWRDYGAITAVKDQGQCGSCWAHSATEAVESYSFLLKSVSSLQTLSVQQTTACTYANYNGCNGGWPYDAYEKAVIARGGEDTAANYPYDPNQAGTCRFGTGKADDPVANIKSYKNIAPGQLATALTTGPPSVCLAASSWQSYTGGILMSCPGDVNHCVQAVGIGGSSSQPYWIVRNSHGANWGEKGYIYLDATVDGGNICHIQEYITTPTE
jgi:hypothetical protein